MSPTTTPQPPNVQSLLAGTPVIDATTGAFTVVWFRFFGSIVSALNYLLNLNLVSLIGGKQPAVAQTTQSKLATLGPTLQKDALVNVTDYGHMLQWNGSAFIWGPGEPGSDWFAFTGGSTRGTGWHACDGSTVNYLKADGTTGSRVLPDSAGTACYVKAGTYNPVINAATLPTISAPTISTPTISVNNATLTTAGFTAGGVTATTQAVHNHSASSSTPTASAPVATLPADPVAYFTAPQWYRQ